MPNVDYIELGIPVFAGGETNVLGLSYCSAASTFLVTVGRPADADRRFFVRGQDEARYRELQPPEPGFWFRRDLVVAANAAYAFVMLEASDTHDSHICSVSLPAGQMVQVPDATGFTPGGRVWVSKLLSCSPDAGLLYVVAAEIPSRRSDGSFTVNYSLARMSVSTGHLDKIVEMPSPSA